MTKYIIDLMGVIRYNNPTLSLAELENAALELYQTIKQVLDENREGANKK